ncbi:MAG: fibronectin type III domain-containing protein [Oscillospiraceae bacterium]|nr:fibronectin type III domain-containing protein [Oscillospiraceae bacterium]
MSEPKLISPLLDGFVMGDPISKHHGVCCCPAMELSTENKYIVKIISVPASQVQLDALLLSGAYSSKEDALAYFSQMSETVCQEAKLLKRLSELEGFAGYTDWQVVPMEDGTGFDVYLLGSYRKTLERQFHQEPMTHLGAVNLGLDLCAALTVARRTGNLYVNLKPSNIYLKENGEYQIGDLGFIPLDSLKYASLPEKYHSSYTVPEVTDAYSSLNDTLDTYAVGLILYQAFNNNTLPYSGFAPSEPLDPPAYADYEIAEIILKACAVDPAQRWEDPVQLGQALVSYLQRNTVNDTPILPPVVEEEAQESEPEAEQETEPEGNLNEISEAIEVAIEPEKPAEESQKELPDDTAAEESPESDDTEPEAVEETDEDAESEAVPEISEEAADDEEIAPDEAESDNTEGAASDEESAQPAETEEADQFTIEGFAEDETAPSEETAGDLLVDQLSQEVSQILAAAEDLIAHETPAPVVAPEPIEITVPSLAPQDASPTEGEEVALEDLTVESEEAEEPAQISFDEVSEASSDNGEMPAYMDDEYDYPPMRYPTRNHYSTLITVLSVILVLLLLAIGGMFFYEDYYLQSIDNMTLTGKENYLIVNLDTDTDNELLSVVCKDAYGNTLTQKVVNDQAVFNDLRPATKYTVSVQIDGFHQLVGTTSSSYTTVSQTSIVNFGAVTGDQDGTVILNFSVQGPENTAWKIKYFAPGIPEKFMPCTAHMAVITGLEVGVTYTFQLVGVADLYITGNDTLEHTVSKVVYPENLKVLGFEGTALKVSWDAAEDAAVESWSVRCYNTEGYDQTFIVTETAATIPDLDITKSYTVDVKAEGMSESGQVVVSTNSVTVSNFTSDDSASGQLKLSWEYLGTAPATNWQILYKVDGSEDQIVTSDKTNCVISPIVPGAHYDIRLELAGGISLYGGAISYDAPAASKFSGYKITADDLTVNMCPTPDDDAWQADEIPSSRFTTTYSADQLASFVLKASKTPSSSKDNIAAMFVIRNANGTPVSINSHSRTWSEMWDWRYCKVEMPYMPNTAGAYTAELYFNGALVHTQSFTVQ